MAIPIAHLDRSVWLPRLLLFAVKASPEAGGHRRAGVRPAGYSS